MSRDGLDPNAALLRGFAVDFLTGHDLEAPARIMAPDYRLAIGGHVLDGRDEKYLPATAEQLERFPGLCVTVHDIVLGQDAAAFRFTEHGASLRHDGKVSAWSGVALFRIADGRLKSCWAEEDYFGRRCQLAAGECDPVEAPHPAPWDARALAPDARAEKAAREWLSRGEALSDLPAAPAPASAAPAPADLIRVSETRIDAIFGAGDRIAFHAEQRGAYAGGFTDVDGSRAGEQIVLRSAGLLTMRDGALVEARVTSDRLGLYYSLAKA